MKDLRDEDHKRWLAALIVRLRACKPGESYTLDPVERSLILDEIDPLDTPRIVR